MRIAAYIGGALGLALLIFLVIREDFGAMLRTLSLGGLALLWLVPYRGVYFLLYAVGWWALLRPYDPQRQAGLGYVFWVTTVREAVDRLLPVASVGGGVIGVRLMRWRALRAANVGATVIVEVLLTLIALYLFVVLGVYLLIDYDTPGEQYHRIVVALLVALPVPVITGLLLRYGSVFGRLHRFLRPLVGEGALSEGAAALDVELRACLHRWGTLLFAGALQCAAFVSGSFEIWLSLRLFGHPIDAKGALVLESMTQALRHLAFMVPSGLGVQEAGLVIFGHALGISGEMALAVSMAKRLREVLCGLPSLASWQWLEGRRFR